MEEQISTRELMKSVLEGEVTVGASVGYFPPKAAQETLNTLPSGLRRQVEDLLRGDIFGLTRHPRIGEILKALVVGDSPADVADRFEVPLLQLVAFHQAMLEEFAEAFTRQSIRNGSLSAKRWMGRGLEKVDRGLERAVVSGRVEELAELAEKFRNMVEVYGRMTGELAPPQEPGAAPGVNVDLRGLLAPGVVRMPKIGQEEGEGGEKGGV